MAASPRDWKEAAGDGYSQARASLEVAGANYGAAMSSSRNEKVMMVETGLSFETGY